MQRLVRNGVGLACFESGVGDPPCVLIHGWACDHTYLSPQFRHLAGNRRTVSIDLRGHGLSDKPDQDYPISEFVDDVAWLCSELQLKKPALIGHSMGGLIAFELAGRVPELPSAVIALDSPIAMSQKVSTQLASLGKPLWGVDYLPAAERLVEGMFLSTDDPTQRERIVAQMTSGPQRVLASAWAGMVGSDSASTEKARPIQVPLLSVASAGGHMSDLGRLKTLSPKTVSGQTVGAGHFHQLEVPEQINDMIDRFLTAYVTFDE